MTSSAALLNSRTTLMIRPSKVRPSRGGFFCWEEKGGGRVGESKASPSYFSECDKVYAFQGYIPSFQMLYYFSLNVILLSVECYITFGRMLYYFPMEVILLLSECYSTSSRK